MKNICQIKKTINEHFKKFVKSYGRGRFVQTNRDLHYKECWQNCNFFLFLYIVNRKQNVRQYVQFIFNNSLKVCGNDDLYGKNMKNQTLFENFKRYWKICHHENKRFFWLGKFMPRLESNICRKWIKSFPDIELFFKLVKDKYDYFNALDFNVYSEN